MVDGKYWKILSCRISIQSSGKRRWFRRRSIGWWKWFSKIRNKIEIFNGIIKGEDITWQSCGDGYCSYRNKKYKITHYDLFSQQIMKGKHKFDWLFYYKYKLDRVQYEHRSMLAWSFIHSLIDRTGAPLVKLDSSSFDNISRCFIQNLKFSLK